MLQFDDKLMPIIKTAEDALDCIKVMAEFKMITELSPGLNEDNPIFWAVLKAARPDTRKLVGMVIRENIDRSIKILEVCDAG
jgi:hypothetical protein